MREGTRTRLWKEGFDQRLNRRQNGFKHDKIEWDVITARDAHVKQFNDEERFEDLNLPTSRLVKKRRNLTNVYDRAQKRDERKKHTLLRNKLSVDDAGLIREKNQNEYEKNKARNYKTNIQFPTPVSTVRTARSSSARPSRAKSGVLRNRRGSVGNSSLKDLNDSLAKLSMKASNTPGSMHLTTEDARALHDLAGNNQTSAMNRYMEMKNKQDMDGMDKSSSAH